MVLLFLNHWRAVIYDTAEGIVVLDVTADNEAEAKGRAHTAAKDHLKCKDIKSCIVMAHVDMPKEWFEKKVDPRAGLKIIH